MTGYRDDPDWQEAQAALIDPGTGDAVGDFIARVRAALKMHEIELSRESAPGDPLPGC